MNPIPEETQTSWMGQ